MRPDTTIFLVDDDPAVRDSLKLLLETYGFIVRDFASGSDFLASGERAENACLVLDMHMPIVSGLDLLEQLAVKSAALPTVIITGRADDSIRQRARAAGAYQVIEKPFDAAALLRAMNHAVDAAQTAVHEQIEEKMCFTRR
jgi:two-component system, LuxR family, response regulator FixJ